MDKALQALGMLCLAQDGGRAPPQPGHSGSPSAGWLVLQSSLPVDMLGTASPLFVPLIPSAQQLPKFNSGVVCFQPPVEHCLLEITPIPPDKGPQIWISPLTSAWQDAEQDSPHARLFETLWWPFSNSSSQCTPLSPPSQTPHFLVDLATMLSQQDTSVFCDLKPSFSEVQLCPFIETKLYRIWFIISLPHHQVSNRQNSGYFCFGCTRKHIFQKIFSYII